MDQFLRLKSASAGSEIYRYILIMAEAQFHGVKLVSEGLVGVMSAL